MFRDIPLSRCVSFSFRRLVFLASCTLHFRSPSTPPVNRCTPPGFTFAVFERGPKWEDSNSSASGQCSSEKSSTPALPLRIFRNPTINTDISQNRAQYRKVSWFQSQALSQDLQGRKFGNNVHIPPIYRYIFHFFFKYNCYFDVSLLDQGKTSQTRFALITDGKQLQNR